MSSKTATERYQVLDEIEHCLRRPSMYIGSTKEHESEEFLYREGRFTKEQIKYNPGFLKLFDEIISNSVDEHKRNPKLNRIQVEVDAETATISIQDNGGIPVEMHKEHKKLIPEIIFSNLRAGSNFDDSEERIVAGTNGVGATLTNIFSLEFKVDTCDGKKKFSQKFSNNMSKRTKPKLSKSTKNFTKITYKPDLKRFNLSEISESHIQMLRKRVVDLAACNPGLYISFNKERFKFRSLKEYATLYCDTVFYEGSDSWEICIGHSSEGYQTVSFANSVQTKDAGTHVNYIVSQIDSKLRQMIKRKHKIDVKPSEIKNHLFLFVNCTIINSSFSSQTKEKLITEPRDFGSKHEVSQRTINKIFKSEVIQSLLDWYEKKKDAEERAKLRKLNKNLAKTKVPKLIDAKKRDNRDNCILGIFEGQCLHEDTLILVKRNENFERIKIKNIKVGDLVLSHTNKLNEVYQKNKKIDTVYEIKLSNGHIIKATGKHKFIVYDIASKEFKLLALSDISKDHHRMLFNRISNISRFVNILKVEANSDFVKNPDKCIIKTQNSDILISKKSKIGIFEKNNNRFLMKFPEEINIGNDMYFEILEGDE